MPDLPQSFGCIPSPPDERDYKLADYLVPTSVDARIWQIGPTLDQNPTPQCVAFGFTDWGNCLPVDDGWSADYAHDFYAACKRIDGYAGDGTYPRVAAKVMQQRGRMNRYAFGNLQEMKAFILASGPVPFAVAWNSGMGSPNGEGVVSPSAGGFPLEHCVLAYGADPTYLYFQNSWGTGWGVNGTAKITWTDLATAWTVYGEACAAVELPLGTPAPIPKPTPTPKKVIVRNLKIGDKGDDVTAFQHDLVACARKLTVNGDYDQSTAQAVLITKKTHAWPEKPLTGNATVAFQGYVQKWATENIASPKK